MMRKAFVFILFIALLTSSIAGAESFFPTIEELYGVELPSVESMTKANPIYSETLSDGSNLYIYDTIFDGLNYDSSGEDDPLFYWNSKLGRDNCELVSSEIKNGVYVAKLKKESSIFYFFYDILSKQVACIYPPGTYAQRVPYSMDVISIGQYGTEVVHEITYNYQTENARTERYMIPATPKPVRWFVLKREGNEAYVLSVRSFGSRQFSASDDCNWKTSDIRKWINEELFNTLFSEEEKKVVIEKPYKTTIWSKIFYSKESREAAEVVDTVETTDRLVLLSVEEAEELPVESRIMLLKDSEYFIRNTTESGDDRGYVSYSGNVCLNRTSDAELEVRVAMWVNMDLITPIQANDALYSFAVDYYFEDINEHGGASEGT